MSHTMGSSYASDGKWSTSRQETIHSGHFMVSHFEAEAQEEEDNELAMPDPDEPIITELNPSEDEYLDAPVKKSTTSFIDISLAKLFKCMNLAYRQKLTSPKWNRFKGVRLRWKDKIRLNNLIWRCWHMQFMMKKKTLVCQFASPLDVDIHSKPEAVVLEGKYWKRQFDVIKAEYMKWRRFYRTRGLGNQSILDTVSEYDTLDWSPANTEKILMGGMDDYFWTADTLFSTINNTPFPFPDPREIAKAGIADFIQPSLGPLQPNLDDFMNGIPFQELLNSQFNTRLPSVPEESSDDIFKAVDYAFPALMDSESIVSSSPSSSGTQNQTSVLNDSPLSPVQYTPKLYSFGQDVNVQPQQNVASYMQSRGQLSPQSQLNISMDAFVNNPDSVENFDHPKKRHLKERIMQTGIKQYGKRLPHNYEKTQPTHHQTVIYNQVIAQQSSSQQHQQHQQQQRQQQHHQQPQIQQSQHLAYPQNAYTNTQNVIHLNSAPIIQTTSNNYLNTKKNIINLPNNLSNAMNMNNYNQSQIQVQSAMNLLPPSGIQPNKLNQNTTMLSLLTQKTQDNTTSVDNIQESYKSASNHQSVAYKPYPSQKTMKIGSPNSGYGQLSPSHITASNINDQSTQQLSSKEMYRSKSLPLNVSLQLQQKESTFIVPKYLAKPTRLRTRSNSMAIKPTHQMPTQNIQSATSEPVLSTLAQLLTSNSNNSTSNQHSFTTGNSKSFAQQPKQEQVTAQQQQYTQHPYLLPSQQSSSLIKSSNVSFTSSTRSPAPSLSPDLVTELDAPISPNRSGNMARFQRRVGHIHAEQKRRYNIKNGFDMLHSLIPQLQQNPNAKLSKAAMLQKGAEYIKLLRTERATINEKMEILKKERDSLNNSLNHLHSVLPANGAPVARQKTGRVKELYNEYVRYRTLENWKFWILGLIFKPLFNSFNTTVSVASMEELSRTAISWVDQHCSLIEMRPAVSNQLRYLSTSTDILSDPPSTLQEEVIKAIS